MIFNIRIIFTIKKDKKRQNDKKTNKDRIIKKTEGQKEKRQKEIYSVYMALLRPSTESTSEIYSNCATSCCTIDLNSNVSYEIMKSMVLDSSNLLFLAYFLVLPKYEVIK